jgi:branched-chain amino acid transport system substrate-binding protein
LARTIKVGWVSPKTGSISAFAAPDVFSLAVLRKAIGDAVVVNGVRHPVQFIVKDSQSDPNRAAEVASSLIKSDNVDLIIAGHAPETTNPVADQAEINGVPCITPELPGRRSSSVAAASLTRALIGLTISAGAWKT